MAFWKGKAKDKHLADERAIFLKEEFAGENLINYIRIGIIFILEATTIGKFDIFGKNPQISITFLVTTIMLGIALLYSIVILVLFRNNIYHPSVKYVGAIVNITLVVLSIGVYRLEPLPEYSQISQLARYSIIFLFYLFTILNYNVRLAIFSGIVAGLEYFFFVVYGNYFANLVYSFYGPDGVLYSSQFKSSEQALKLVYVFVGGGVAAVVAGRLRNLVRRVIREQQEKVELEKERQKLAQAVIVENRKYLDNVSDGLVLIDRDLIMREQYSKAFVQIFNDERIAGRNFVDFLFPDAKKQAIERKDLENFLKILFSNETADLDMIMDINPMKNKPVTVRGSDGASRKKIIQVDFKRIAGPDNAVENVMAVVEDRTKAVEAQAALSDEKTKREEELDMIQTILRLSPATLSEFFAEAGSQLQNVEALLAGKPGREKIDAAFREIHSLRGTTRTLGFRTLSDYAQKVEYFLAEVRDDYENAIAGFSLTFLNEFDALNTELDKIRGLFDRFKFFVNVNLRERSENLASQLDEFLSLLKNMTRDLGKELGKEIVFRSSKNIDGLPFLARIRNPIIHLVRNAIDHGIEDSFERLSKGKLGYGTIRLRIELADGSYTIDLQDNGRGIDFEKIKNKALEKKLLPAEKSDLTQGELVRFIFMPGFSSKDLHTDISGSGVGLDIVKDSVKKLGGNIIVSTKPGRGTRFRIVVPAHREAGTET